MDNFLNKHKRFHLPQQYFWNCESISFMYNGFFCFYKIFEKKLICLNSFKKPLSENDLIFIKLKKLNIITKTSEEKQQHNLLSKIKFAQYHNSNQKLNITLATTLRCNFSCPYCFEIKNKRPSMRKDDLFFLTKYFINYYKQDNKQLDITWYGGEPLIDIKSIKYLTEKLNKENVKYSSEILTNGYLLNNNTIKEIQKINLKQIQITLDGPKNCHNTYRFLTNSDDVKIGTYKTILTNLKNLLNQNLTFQIVLRINCTKENVDQIYSFLECPYFLSLDKNKFKIYFGQIDSFDRKKYYNKIKNLNKKFLELNYKVIYTRLDSLREFSCSALKDNDLCIGPNLELYECYSDFGHKDRIIGNLKKPGSIKIKSQYRNAILLNKCRTCEILPICYAESCPYRLKNKFLLNTNKYCFDRKTNVLELLQKLAAKTIKTEEGLSE